MSTEIPAVDTVEEDDQSTKLITPIDFVDESGEIVDTFPQVIQPEDLQPHKESVNESLNEAN